MATPHPFEEPAALEARLVTKTSLPKPKAAIALLVLLWLAKGRPGAVIYGRESGTTDDGGIIDDEIVAAVRGFFGTAKFEFGHEEIRGMLNGNPLLESQMESLNSAFELVWRLGTFSFTDPSLGRTSERTGGVRYQKKIRFSANLDLLDILVDSDPKAFAGVLLNWLDGSFDCDERTETKLERMLAVFAEGAFYKTSKGEDGTVYTVAGVYDPLLAGASGVDIVDAGAEAQGTTRILKPAIGAGLYPGLEIKNNTVSLEKGAELEALSSYVERMRVSAEVANVKLNHVERNIVQSVVTADPVNEPRNLIYFGAPGTGKSYELNKTAGKNFPEENISRVTFYPDYTYSQFVGCFKPMTERVADENGSKKSVITYRYVLGPFLETYVKACKNPGQNYLLIVEEINRANPAAVFGDVFQLLDRRSDGCSEYSVAASEEMREQVASELGKESGAIDKLAIPSNMYIWATMNSADQGVFPMDTAFKRRWDFRYMGIDEGETADIDGKPLNEITVPCGGRQVVWNNLRKAINEFMSKDLGINEDKLLGPFFVSPSALNEERFGHTFKDKVLLYLYEDAGKTKRQKMFKKGLTTYAEICDEFDRNGELVFGGAFNDHLVWGDGSEDDGEAEE